MEDDKFRTVDDEALTVALHIGLPSPSSDYRISPSADSTDKLGENSSSAAAPGYSLNTSNGQQYWIPTPTQILVGPTQFSCPVCCKTFNRYNNLQSRCICGGMDLSTERDPILRGTQRTGMLRLPCYCCAPGCNTTSITQERERSKISELSKPTTKGNMESNPSCAGNVTRLLRSLKDHIKAFGPGHGAVGIASFDEDDEPGSEFESSMTM
ncbi:Detected protein of unknown function [Hibiscus syriacus]|uniref:Uncharacterized protein n=1 Tax=Hibiscus syriacus TaxID=106335 RepID=A0A6A3C013_HIBSY|nr:Detected protein of unknown function [Hibiscus syriacus]